MRLIKLKGGKETIMENQLIMNNDIRPKNLIKFLTLAAIFSVAIIGTAHADDDNRGRIQNNHRNGRIQHNDSRQWREHENATRGIGNNVIMFRNLPLSMRRPPITIRNRAMNPRG